MRYFGYGSNLNGADFARWCDERGLQHEGVRPLGRAWLPDAEPVFHYRSRARRGGALNVRPRLGSAVPGVLFEADANGWEALDRKEGAGRFYERHERVVLTERGEPVSATTYVVSPGHRLPHHVPPTADYLETVTAGLRAHGLPEHQVRAAGSGWELPALPAAIFVYGTLRRGESRASLLERHAPAEWSPGTTAGALLDLGRYPGLVEGDGPVVGEVVELDDPGAAMRELDEVEGFVGYDPGESLYHRVIVGVDRPDGRRITAWTYRYVRPVSEAAVIATGDWCARDV